MNIDFPKNHKIGVACSGGADSMALLCLLLENGADVVAVHVNHGLRINAVADADFVRDFCLSRHVPCRVFDAPDKPLAQTEEAARKYRYACFETALSDGTADCMALAHHLEDNAETIFLHLLRGCGTDGLVGMTAADGNYIRPLLSYPRRVLEDYLALNGVSFRTDESNADVRYNRNFLRAEIFPRLIARFPDCVAAVNRTGQIVARDLAALDSALTVPPLKNGCVHFPLTTASSLAAARTVYLGTKQLLTSDLESAHVERILSLFDSSVGATADVKHGVLAAREPDAVVLYRPSPRSLNTESWRVPTGTETIWNGEVTLTSVGDISIPALPALVIDADRVPSCAVWRTRRNGDVFTPFGGGTKSLGDYFTDCKLPVRKRDAVPLLCMDDTVLVVVGMEINRNLRLTENTRRIVKIEGKYE